MTIFNDMWPFLWLLLSIALADSYDKRIFDVTSLPVHSVVIKAGENKSLACPGVSEHSLVLALEWLSLTNHLKLVEFMSDTTTVWVNQHRISLLSDSYGLIFHPAAAEDSGDYVCLVNSRPKPDALVRLIVQDVPDPPGRPLIMSFTSRSVNLSWAPSQDTHHSPVTHYIIHVRKMGPAAVLSTKEEGTIRDWTFSMARAEFPVTMKDWCTAILKELNRPNPFTDNCHA